MASQEVALGAAAACCTVAGCNAVQHACWTQCLLQCAGRAVSCRCRPARPRCGKPPMTDEPWPRAGDGWLRPGHQPARVKNIVPQAPAIQLRALAGPTSGGTMRGSLGVQAAAHPSGSRAGSGVGRPTACPGAAQVRRQPSERPATRRPGACAAPSALPRLCSLTLRADVLGSP